MSTKKGFIKWYRDAIENPLFCKKPFDEWHAFEYLCFRARKYPGDLMLDNGAIIHLEIGQYFTSREKLADVFGWTVKKLRAWEKRINRLKMGTAKGTPWGTVYTLENYYSHQYEGQAEGQAKGQTTGQTPGQQKRKNKESIKKDARAGVSEAPAAVVPMNDEIRYRLQKTIKGI